LWVYRMVSKLIVEKLYNKMNELNFEIWKSKKKL